MFLNSEKSWNKKSIVRVNNTRTIEKKLWAINLIIEFKKSKGKVIDCSSEIIKQRQRQRKVNVIEISNWKSKGTKLRRTAQTKRKWSKIYETKLLKYKITKRIVRRVNWNNGKK